MDLIVGDTIYHVAVDENGWCKGKKLNVDTNESEDEQFYPCSYVGPYNPTSNLSGSGKYINKGGSDKIGNSFKDLYLCYDEWYLYSCDFGEKFYCSFMCPYFCLDFGLLIKYIDELKNNNLLTARFDWNVKNGIKKEEWTYDRNFL